MSEASGSEFIDYLVERLSPVLGKVTARSMFGGHGIFQDGCMFGLVADDQLYLKVDKQTEQRFEAEDLPHFEYSKNEKTMQMSYCLAPEVIYDDDDELREWGRLAIEAALRAKRSK